MGAVNLKGWVGLENASSYYQKPLIYTAILAVCEKIDWTIKAPQLKSEYTS
jgi:hypothetical protein